MTTELSSLCAIIVSIGHFGKYHNTLCLSPQILHQHCFQFLLGITMVLGGIKNNAYSKFVWTNKEYYGIFQNRMETFQQAKKKHDSKLIRLRI